MATPLFCFRHTKNKICALLLILSTSHCSVLYADTFDIQQQLPDLGTTAGNTLSINQEISMGDFYVRQLRASTPLIYDPLLVQYINQLGQRLVAHANSVRTPFHFYLVDNPELNAFAFFGGNVVLHSSLFHYTSNESELASVMAHEISHVTQRHLARAMEQQQQRSPLTWVGALGSILLAMASPQAGMAALTGTLAGTQQSIISFTQANEKEADRIGIQVLQRSNFDPQAMPAFMGKLADMARYSSKPPEILLTHPLPDSRLADARNRANQMLPNPVQSSLNYYLAKARILVLYQGRNNDFTDELFKQWQHGNVREQTAARYGLALQAYQQKQLAKAQQLLQPLLTAQPSNSWYLDLYTDVMIDQHQAGMAITKLKPLADKDPVLMLNLANAYLANKQASISSDLLYRYTYQHPDDINGWQLLSDALGQQANRQDEEYAARASLLALSGQFGQAVELLTKASNSVAIGSLSQARYDAQVDQIRHLQQQFAQYQR